MLSVTAVGVHALLSGFAAILWPTVVILVIILFHSEIADILRRLRKGKVLGQEIELDQSLDRLQAQAEVLQQAEVHPSGSRVPIAADIIADGEITGIIADGELTGPQPGQSFSDEEIRKILELATESPKVALLYLSSEIEERARHLVAVTGHLREVRGGSIRELASILERAISLPSGTLDALRSFSQVRNKIVHATKRVSDDETLRAIDSGIVILQALRAVPYEHNVVFNPGVPVYSDPYATNVMTGVRGVILETTSPDGNDVTYRIFPTTRTDCEVGQQVAWEWNMDVSRIWPAAWYRDPLEGDIREAWGSSMEFIGRHLTDL